MVPHQEGKTSQPFTVQQGEPKKVVPQHSPIQLVPAGQKTARDILRQKSDKRNGRADDAHPVCTIPIRTRLQKAR